MVGGRGDAIEEGRYKSIVRHVTHMVGKQGRRLVSKACGRGVPWFRAPAVNRSAIATAAMLHQHGLGSRSGWCVAV